MLAWRMEGSTITGLSNPIPAGDALALGVEFGGIHSTEALLLARYFMFMQVLEWLTHLQLVEFLRDCAFDSPLEEPPITRLSAI